MFVSVVLAGFNVPIDRMVFYFGHAILAARKVILNVLTLLFFKNIGKGWIVTLLSETKT